MPRHEAEEFETRQEKVGRANEKKIVLFSFDHDFKTAILAKPSMINC